MPLHAEGRLVSRKAGRPGFCRKPREVVSRPAGDSDAPPVAEDMNVGAGENGYKTGRPIGISPFKVVLCAVTEGRESFPWLAEPGLQLVARRRLNPAKVHAIAEEVFQPLSGPFADQGRSDELFLSLPVGIVGVRWRNQEIHSHGEGTFSARICTARTAARVTSFKNSNARGSSLMSIAII